MEKGNSCGAMEESMKETSTMDRYTDKELICGAMDEFIKGYEGTGRCRAKGLWNTRTVGNTKESS